jgi:hypothetical protein
MAEENKSNGKQDEGNPEFRNFQQLLKQVLSVPKEKLDEKRTEYKQSKERSKRAG